MKKPQRGDQFTIKLMTDLPPFLRGKKVRFIRTLPTGNWVIAFAEDVEAYSTGDRIQLSPSNLERI